jgi:hypothetical protein
MGTIKDIKDGWGNYLKANVAYDSLDEDVKKLAEERAAVCRECPLLTKSSLLTVIERFLPGTNQKGKIMETFNPENPDKGEVVQGYKCGSCGCGFPALVFAPGKNCPENKWEK